MLCYGYISYKNQFFPYQIIKFFKQTSEPRSDLEAKNPEEDKIRSKYKNWNKSNVNFKVIFIKEYSPGLNIYSDRDYSNRENDEKIRVCFHDCGQHMHTEYWPKQIKSFAAPSITLL